MLKSMMMMQLESRLVLCEDLSRYFTSFVPHLKYVLIYRLKYVLKYILKYRLKYRLQYRLQYRLKYRLKYRLPTQFSQAVFDVRVSRNASRSRDKGEPARVFTLDLHWVCTRLTNHYPTLTPLLSPY